jgi:uncharacterized membrane-anchored protein
MQTAVIAIGLACFLSSIPAFAQTSPGPAQKQMLSRERLIELQSSLKWQQGNIILGNNLATLKVSRQFRYLSPEDTKTVLVDLWNNPPEIGSGTLGMIFPVDVNPLSRSSWGVVITYQADGYVRDDDAEKINYADLLKQIQQATDEGNAERTKQGYPPMKVVGWAEQPHYDKANHKIYWAKELQFGERTSHTLNYSIRALGRQGVLELNAVAGMSDLDAIKQQMPDVISMIEFNAGSRYADFTPGRDKVAEYGLAALILGGVAAKIGLFKGIFLALLAAKKLIIVAVVAVAGFIGRIFGFKKKSKATASLPSDLIGRGPDR